MKTRFAAILAITAASFAPQLFAQTQARPSVAGTWRGSSICLVHPSSCRDETVVYRVTPTATRDSLSMDALKIVNGAEEDMGILGCRFNTATAKLTCTMPNGVWNFTVRGDSLIGDLRLPNGTKFRDVRAVRSK